MEEEHAAEDVVQAVEDDRIDATIRTIRTNGRRIGMTSTDKNFRQGTVLREFLREKLTLSRKNIFFLNRIFIQISADVLVFSSLRWFGNCWWSTQTCMLQQNIHLVIVELGAQLLSRYTGDMSNNFLQ